MRVTLYKNSGVEKDVSIPNVDTQNFESTLEMVKRRFPKSELLIDGNQFKWLKNGESRILISIE